MTGNETLLDEVKTTLAARAGPAADSAWVGADRRRLVPYLTLGGATIGMIVGIVNAGAEGLTNRQELLGVGLIVGVPSGITLGWGLLGLARHLPSRTSILVVRAVRLLLALATYLGASVAAAAGIRLFSGSADGLLDSILGALQASAVLGLILVPLSFAMARSSATASATGSTLSQTIGEALEGGPEAPLSTVGGTAIITFLWLLVSSFAVLGALIFLRSVARAAYDGAVDAFGGALTIAVLVTWIAITVSGTAFSRRLIYGRSRTGRSRL